MSCCCAYPFAINQALYRLTEPSVLYLTLYTTCIQLALHPSGRKPDPRFHFSLERAFLPPSRHCNSCPLPLLRSSLAHALLLWASCTHNDAPCTCCIRTTPRGSFGKNIGAISALPILRPFGQLGLRFRRSVFVLLGVRFASIYLVFISVVLWHLLLSLLFARKSSPRLLARGMHG